MVIETLDRPKLESIKQKGRRRSFKKGAQIFRHGDPGASMLIVASGKAEVSITSYSGHKSILGLVGEGDVVGDIACLDGGPRSADVTALGRLEAIEILRRDMLQILRDDSESAILVIEALCQKARNASEMFELKALPSGQSRLASCILRLLNDEGGDLKTDRVRVSQSWLGSYAGLTRENVNRQLKAWAGDGIARFESGKVVVSDVSALAYIAMQDSD